MSKAVTPTAQHTSTQPYTPPQLTPLGRWATVTLAGSVPFNPARLPGTGFTAQQERDV